MENIEAKWEALSAKIGESGPAVVEAMKELYSVFGTDVLVPAEALTLATEL